MSPTVTCHTCSGNGRDTNDPERACKRCDGEGERDVREAGAHRLVVHLQNELAAASQGSNAWWLRVRDELRAAKDVWEAELTRLATERAA